MTSARQPAEAAVELTLHELRTFGQRVYEHLGVPGEDAAVVVDAQLDADLRGVDTHGLQRLPWYVGNLERGESNPAPSFQILRESPVHVLLDADRAIGQLACVRLMEATMAKAENTGMAVGATVNSNDWGCGAYYPRLAARRGFIAFATTTSIPTLAPYGSRSRVLGNNPMAFAVPRPEGEPIVLDMALTPVALGKVLRALDEGVPIPEEWGFRDADGQPTTDPSAALTGVVPTIGGYKGTGLAMMMNVLAGVLPGGFHSSEVGPGRRGQLFQVISPELFQPRQEFDERVEAMVAQIEAAEPLPGSPGVFLPGQPEQQRAEAASARGLVRYPSTVVAALSQLGERLSIDVPAGARARPRPE